MKKKILMIVLSILFIAPFCYAYDEVNILGKTPFAYERTTVTTAAVLQLDATYRATAGAVFITIENNNIRYRIDGGDPSIINGHLVVSALYQNIWLFDPSSIRNFRMIGIGGNSIVLITYYR